MTRPQLRPRKRVGNNRDTPGTDAVPSTQVVFHYLRLGDDNVGAQMAVCMPAVRRYQVLTESPACIGHRITIDDPGILQKHGSRANSFPRDKISQAKESVRIFFAADFRDLIIQQARAVQEARPLLAYDRTNIAAGNGIVILQIRHDQNEFVRLMAGKS